MALEGGGFMAGYLNAGEQMAQTQGQVMANALNAQKIQQQAIAMDIAAKSRQAEIDYWRGKQMGAVAPNGAAPNVNMSLTPEALAANEGDMPGTGAGMHSMGDMGGRMPGAMPKLSDILRKGADDAIELAKAKGSAGDVAAAEKLRTDARENLAKAATAENEERKQEQEKWQNIKNLASAPYDQSSLNDMVAMGKLQFGPDFTKYLDTAKIPRDPNNPNNYLWNDLTAAKIAHVKDQALSQLDRMKRADQEQAIADRRQNAIEAGEDRKVRLQLLAQSQENQREGRENSRALQEERLARQKKEDAAKATQNVQRSLERDPVYNNFPRYQMSMDQAKDTIKLLSSPNGYDQITAPDMRALASSFQNMSEGYRTRVGGKYALQDMDKFNGLLQKMDRYVGSLGRATPTFSESTARDVANTMTQIYDIANKNAVIASLEGKETAQTKGGNPDEIRIRGDLQRLFQTKQAKVVEEKGKRYLVIGREGQQQHRFLDTPEEP
jgi:hypothetical protein